MHGSLALTKHVDDWHRLGSGSPGDQNLWRFPPGKTAVTRVEPQETWIAKGTTIVWHNLSKKEIKILFPKGKECQEATGARVLWKLDPRACLITDFSIPFGGTTSALFNSIGRYDYEIEYVGEKSKEKGSVLVRTEPYGVNK